MVTFASIAPSSTLASQLVSERDIFFEIRKVATFIIQIYLNFMQTSISAGKVILTWKMVARR